MRVCSSNRVKVVMTLVLAVSLTSCRGPNQKWCEDLRQVGQDQGRMTYLIDWVNVHLADPEFLEIMGELGQLSTLDDKEQMLKLDLNWEFLGLESQYGSIELIRDSSDKKEYLKASSIKAFRLGLGRNSLFLRVNEFEDFGTDMFKGVSGEITHISDNVILNCD